MDAGPEARFRCRHVRGGRRPICSTRPPSFAWSSTGMPRPGPRPARGRGQAGEFERRLAALREEHLRKSSLITRLDRAGLTL
jgi:hypothetical protein